MLRAVRMFAVAMWCAASWKGTAEMNCEEFREREREFPLMDGSMNGTDNGTSAVNVKSMI